MRYALLIIAALVVPVGVNAEPTRNLRKFLCVTAAHRAAANTALEAKYGADNFSMPMIPVTPPDAAPATHFCTDWQMSAAEFADVQALLSGIGSLSIDDRGHWDPAQAPNSVAALASARGIRERKVR